MSPKRLSFQLHLYGHCIPPLTKWGHGNGTWWPPQASAEPLLYRDSDEHLWSTDNSHQWGTQRRGLQTGWGTPAPESEDKYPELLLHLRDQDPCISYLYFGLITLCNWAVHSLNCYCGNNDNASITRFLPSCLLMVTTRLSVAPSLLACLMLMSVTSGKSHKFCSSLSDTQIKQIK